MRRQGIFLAAALAALPLAGCSGGEPPAGNSLAASCSAKESNAAIVTLLDFTRSNEDGTVPGFDVDGKVSDETDDASCNMVDLVDEEGRKGIDNQLALLIPDIEAIFGDAVTGLVQGAINNGELIILLDMQASTDLKDDECVNLAVDIGDGRVSLGTDGVIEAYQTFDVNPKSEHNVAEKGRIENGVMTAGPFEMAVPLALFDVAFTLHFHQAKFRFTIDDDGKMRGMFGGGIDVQELMDGVKDGDGLEDVLPLMKAVLGGSADLAKSDGSCKQISSALRFEAVPAFIRR